ncbi:hypothetical protein MKS88_001362 [Plasmodium brasilianum]|uniref:Uncharacterized protein n=1 Tax=Plasmodium brasilianum TaxID=5824 RepID=A0ACB9YF34_PLABR|nr:hypothetical protein MKS88_001362 [Plasmodium brasilianum]
MSYLLDDKKIILKELLSKNENIKHENEYLELENRAFLLLIEKYEERKKFIKILEYIHYVCTSLYDKEQNFNYNILHTEFLRELKSLLDDCISKYRNILKSILTKRDDEYLSISQGALPRMNNYKEKKSRPKEGIYDVNIEDIITHKRDETTYIKEENEADGTNGADGANGADEAYEVIDNSFADSSRKSSMNCTENRLQNEAEKGNLMCPTNGQKQQHVPKEIEHNKGQINSEAEKDNDCNTLSLIKEKNICLHWSKEESKEEFYSVQSFKRHESTDGKMVLKNMSSKRMKLCTFE